MKTLPEWPYNVNVGGLQGNQRGKLRPEVLDYATGLSEARNHLGQGIPKRGHYVEIVNRWLRGPRTWAAAGNGRDQPQDDENQLAVAAARNA